jgi:hypothetical protein
MAEERHIVHWPAITLGLLFRVIALVCFLLVIFGVSSFGPFNADTHQWIGAGLFWWVLSSITG